jgi:hypothetical protein
LCFGVTKKYHTSTHGFSKKQEGRSPQVVVASSEERVRGARRLTVVGRSRPRRAYPFRPRRFFPSSSSRVPQPAPQKLPARAPYDARGRGARGGERRRRPRGDRVDPARERARRQGAHRRSDRDRRAIRRGASRPSVVASGAALFLAVRARSSLAARPRRRAVVAVAPTPAPDARAPADPGSPRSNSPGASA